MRFQTIRGRAGTRKRATGEGATMVSRAYHVIRDLITAGRLAPGSPVVERELARRLGMSPTPIRAALHRLAQQGYLVTGGAGRVQRMLVAPLLQADMEELFFLIGDLEGWAAHRCAGLAGPARTALLEQMAAVNRALEVASAVRSPDIDRCKQLDYDWHQLVIDAGAGPRLAALLATIKPQASRYDQIYVASLTGTTSLSVAEHAAVEAGIRRGDGERARDAMMRNWTNGATRLGRVIEARGDVGVW